MRTLATFSPAGTQSTTTLGLPLARRSSGRSYNRCGVHIGKAGPILALLDKRQREMDDFIAAVEENSFIPKEMETFEVRPVMNEIEGKVTASYTVDLGQTYDKGAFARFEMGGKVGYGMIETTHHQDGSIP